VLAPLRKSGGLRHTAIFLPTYLEYTRLRRYLREQSIDFVGISECVSPPIAL
jgi:hypothetical protein